MSENYGCRTLPCVRWSCDACFVVAELRFKLHPDRLFASAIQGWCVLLAASTGERDEAWVSLSLFNKA